MGNRSYKKLYLIVTEGSKTEPIYFSMFNHDEAIFRIKCLDSKGASAPPKLLAQMQKYLDQEGIKNTDEAWIIVDKDSWTNDQLQALHDWSQTEENFHLALSNPKFEYWLLLHFEEGNGIASSQNCSDRLLSHLPSYQKGSIDLKKLKPGINNAIMRAARRDHPPCEDWPKSTGTTVYRLVQKLI